MPLVPKARTSTCSSLARSLRTTVTAASMDTLLDRARAVKVKEHTQIDTDDEFVELAAAWALGEVTYTQVMKVTGANGSNAYAKLAFGLAKYVRDLHAKKQ